MKILVSAGAVGEHMHVMKTLMSLKYCTFHASCEQYTGVQQKSNSDTCCLSKGEADDCQIFR